MQEQILEAIVDVSCGLDVHKDKIDACVIKRVGTNRAEIFQQTFSTVRSALMALLNWIVGLGCSDVLMESTSVYWMPIYETLEEVEGMNVSLGNARHMKNVPGRPKTDKEDAKWISKLCMFGLVRKSFVAGRPFRELREYTRYHKKLVQDKARQVNRIEKLLQMNGFKLSTVLSDIDGASGKRILNKLCEKGFLTEQDVREAIDRRVKKSSEEILSAISGNMKMTSRALLKMQLKKLGACEKEIEEIFASMVELAAPYQSAIKILDSIPGIDVLGAIYIIAEISTDMSSFETSKHIASWAGLAPKDEESAGKLKSSKTKKANQYVKSILVECAWAITRTRGTRLSNWYWSHVGKLGKKKAITAVARKLLVYIYAMLKSGTLYDKSLDEADEEENRAAKLESAKKIVGNQNRVVPNEAENSELVTNGQQLKAETASNQTKITEGNGTIGETVAATPKKRGRPKKVTEQTEDSVVSTPKKRGRPRKTPDFPPEIANL